MTSRLDKLNEWAISFAKKKGIRLNPSQDVVTEVLSGLEVTKEKYSYKTCPCRIATGNKEDDKDIICPCQYLDEDLKEHGTCYCQLFVTEAWMSCPSNKGSIPDRRS